MCWIFHLKKLFLIRIFIVCDRERNVENAEAQNGSIRILDNLVINLFSSKNNLKARRGKLPQLQLSESGIFESSIVTTAIPLAASIKHKIIITLSLCFVIHYCCQCNCIIIVLVLFSFSPQQPHHTSSPHPCDQCLPSRLTVDSGSPQASQVFGK